MDLLAAYQRPGTKEACGAAQEGTYMRRRRLTYRGNSEGRQRNPNECHL
jgi:hypothetical protein